MGARRTAAADPPARGRFTGYLAAGAALIAGFIEFALGSLSVTWPMNIVGGLILAYGIGLAFYSRRV